MKGQEIHELLQYISELRTKFRRAGSIITEETLQNKFQNIGSRLLFVTSQNRGHFENFKISKIFRIQGFICILNHLNSMFYLSSAYL